VRDLRPRGSAVEPGSPARLARQSRRSGRSLAYDPRGGALDVVRWQGTSQAIHWENVMKLERPINAEDFLEYLHGSPATMSLAEALAGVVVLRRRAHVEALSAPARREPIAS
jgi:hypothetical protein